MADRLVQQHARPSRAQHHWQGTGRRRDRFEVHQGLAQRLTGVAHDPLFGEETVVGTPATTLPAAFATAVLLNDDAHIETHQRPHICSQAAVRCSDEDALPDPGHAHADLLDTRVKRAGRGIDTLQQLDLFGTAEYIERVVRRIQRDH